MTRQLARSGATSPARYAGGPPWGRTLVLGVLAGLLGASASPQGIDARAWRDDLNHLALELKLLHVDPFHTIDREYFERQVARLYRRIPTMRRHEIIVEMSRLVARIGDGHTRMWLLPSRANGFHRYALRLYEMDGSLYVVSVDARYPQAFGGKLLAIDETGAGEAYRRALELAHADNDMTRRSIAPRYLVVPEVLAALGVVEAAGEATFFIERTDGQRQRLMLAPEDPAGLPSLRSRQIIPDTSDSAIPMVGLGSSGGRVPRWLMHPDLSFWSDFDPASRTLYLQVNAIRDTADRSLATFFREALTGPQGRHAERLVIDLRLNGGGNNYLNYALVHEILSRDDLNQPGRLFGLISRHTFSAASHLVSKLELHTRIVFVGEPTGATPNHFGDAPQITLPNSGLVASASSQFWQNTRPYPHEDREWTPPLLAADLTIDDYLGGRDPAMEAVAAYEPLPSLAARLIEVLDGGGVPDAVAELARFRADRVNRYVEPEPQIDTVGQWLLERERPFEAIELLELSIRENPESEYAHRRLADAYAAAGLTDQAIEHYLRTLEIRPGRFSPAKWGARAGLGKLLGSTP